MYNVSLLPSEYRILNKQARKKDYILLIAIAIMCLLLLAYFVLSIVSVGKHSELKELKARNSEIEDQIATLVNVEELDNEVKKINDKIKTAMGTTPKWADIITEIGNTVKPTTSIISIKMDYNDETGKCVIEGKASNLDVITEWLNELETVPGIDDITLIISDNSFTIKNYISFELNMNLLPNSEDSQEVADL